MSKTYQIIGGFMNVDVDENELLDRIVEFAEENGWLFLGSIKESVEE
jgi:hypothetical protein